MWRGCDLFGGGKNRFSVRQGLVLLAILAIFASVATRTFHGFAVDHPSVRTDASHAKRQHLDADAVVLTNPVSNLGAVLLPVAAPHAPPSEPRVHTVELTQSLYHRPPPPISLL